MSMQNHLMNHHLSLDPRPNPRGRVRGKTLPGSVLSAGMPPWVLMRERMSLQPTSARVRLMTGSEYMVEHRNFEYWNSAWPITLKIWKRKSVADFRNRAFAAFQLDTSEKSYSPDPSSRVGSGVQTSVLYCPELAATRDYSSQQLQLWWQMELSK